MGGHEEREQTLNQLLAEMDGFDARKGVIIMAATNRPEVLDPALLRPGRFDRQVLVDKPDVRGREAILRIHARTVKMAPEANLKIVAARTAGFAGADLANLVNEAALLAARKDKPAVEMADLEEAIDRLIAGLEKKRVMSDKERRIVAYHESGHALVATVQPGLDPVHKISIVQRGFGRSATRCSSRSRIATCSRAPTCSTSWRCSWAAAAPRRSRSTRSRPARRTTSSAPPTSHARWSPNTG